MIRKGREDADSLRIEIYCLSKSWPILYINLLNEMGQDFLDIQWMEPYCIASWYSELPPNLSTMCVVYYNIYLTRLYAFSYILLNHIQ